MTAEELAVWNALPDVVNVYRGCGADNIHGACWSLSKEVAAGFAQLNRYQVAEPLLVAATVAKADVLAVKLDREEAEVITLRATLQAA